MRLRRSALLISVCAVLAVPSAHAQRRELTFMAGTNLTGATGPGIFKSQSRVGFQSGFSLRMPRSPRFSFQTEFLVVQRRLYAEREPSTASPVLVGPISDAPSLWFAEIPLLLRFERGYSTETPVRPFLVVGPFVGVRLACRREVVEANNSVRHTDCSTTPSDVVAGSSPFIPAIYQSLDAGLLGAFGVEVRRFSFSVRAERSFRSLVDSGALPTSPLDNAKSWTLSANLEYLLRVL